MRKRNRFLVIVPAFIVAACSDSGTDAGSPDDNISLGIRIVNTGTEDLELETNADADINFCYESEGCDDLSGGSRFI